MAAYIAILRGINVGGNKSIRMETLKESFKKLGFRNVTTYVQSGNIIFNGEEQSTAKLELKIEEQIKVDFGYEVPVIVLTASFLQNVVENNPFTNDSKKDHAFLHVTFLSRQPENSDIKLIEKKKLGGEEIIFSERAIYLYCPDGYGRTNLNNNFLEKKLKVTATTRNWKTANELLKIAQNL
jgi:uncharacterized protein (DUF1697 family)